MDKIVDTMAMHDDKVERDLSSDPPHRRKQGVHDLRPLLSPRKSRCTLRCIWDCWVFLFFCIMLAILPHQNEADKDSVQGAGLKFSPNPSLPALSKRGAVCAHVWWCCLQCLILKFALHVLDSSRYQLWTACGSSQRTDSSVSLRIPTLFSFHDRHRPH